MTIKQLLDKIEAQKNIQKQIIVVDDCSYDGSKELISNYPFKSQSLFLKHDTNSGKGACIQTAKKFVDGDLVLIQDADLEYDPNDYELFIRAFANSEIKVIYGSRFLNNKDFRKTFISNKRVLANKILTLISNIINKQNLTDAHTCYKVFRKEIFDQINLSEKRFAFCPEVTTKLSRLGIKIFEVPINYYGRKYTEGKKIGFLDGFSAIFALLKYKFFKQKEE